MPTASFIFLTPSLFIFYTMCEQHSCLAIHELIFPAVNHLSAERSNYHLIPIINFPPIPTSSSHLLLLSSPAQSPPPQMTTSCCKYGVSNLVRSISAGYCS